MSVKRGTELELDIEKFADRGKSLARVEGYVVFVAGAVPGDRVRARVTKRKKSYAEARLLEVLRPSALRTAPRCRYFGVCGGCKWQHVAYAAQCEAKRESVHDALVHAGGFEGVAVRPTLGADAPYFYRNKMEFSFSAQRWLTPAEVASEAVFDKGFALGLHIPGQFSKVLDLEECHLQSALSVQLVNAVREWVRAREWAPWHVQRHTGFLRNLVLREGTHTGEVMVNLVTNGYVPERMEAMASFLQDRFPEVTTFVNTVNTGVAQTAFGEAIHTIYGPGVIHDMIGRYRFEIAPNAFFQTNTKQAERLYGVARDFAELRPEDVLYDLYCGAGTISIYMAEAVTRVVGVELIEAAVENARANAVANGIRNCVFQSGDLMKMFTPTFVAAHGRPDVIVVDPPRAGMHKQVVAQLIRLRPERLVYVSCNPQTQARDLALLSDAYTLGAVQPVDLFPHTHHVENVVQLKARTG